jgi:hypothetical protein
MSASWNPRRPFGRFFRTVVAGILLVGSIASLIGWTKLSSLNRLSRVTALFSDVQRGTVDDVRRNLDPGMDLNTLREPDVREEQSLIQRVMDSFRGSKPTLRQKTPTLLEFATRDRVESYDIVKLLLERGADPNVYTYQSATYWAVSFGDKRLVDLLLDHGAHLEAPKGSPLEGAIRAGNPEMVELLLDRGARIPSHWSSWLEGAQQVSRQAHWTPRGDAARTEARRLIEIALAKDPSRLAP